MASNLELTTRVIIETEHSSLYGWSLNEFQADGKNVGRPVITWPYSLYFIATEVSHIHSTELEEFPEPRILEVDFIKCALNSVNGEFRRPVTYSMFGTQRHINLFTLQVHRILDDKQERCELTGNIEWEDRDDFSSQITTFHDELYITIHLCSDRFDRLLRAIGDGKDTEVRLRLQHVSGFYSQWSPDFRTSFIKVLADQKRQVPVIPEELGKIPPVLGTVGAFDIYAVRVIQGPSPPAKESDHDVETLTPPPPNLMGNLGMVVISRLNQIKYALLAVIVLLALLLILKH